MGKSNPYLKKATGGVKAAGAGVKRHGLGRGLDTLLSKGAPAEIKPAAAQVVATSPAVGVIPPASEVGLPLELKIAEIERSPYQPRRDFREEELNELAESIKNNGLVQPPTVRKNSKGRYELIAGERRVRAAQFLGWDKIRVTLVEADDLTAATMTTAENIQREDLNPIEEAVSYKTLQDTFSLTQQQVAERVGKGRATVANSVRLLELPDEVRALISSSLISVGHAKVLLSLEDEKDRVLLARDCVNDQLTVRALERKVARIIKPIEVKPRGTPDLPDGYVRNLAERMKRHLGCAVRVTSGVTHANGKHTKGVVEIDFFDNDDLDRIIKMLGVIVE